MLTRSGRRLAQANRLRLRVRLSTSSFMPPGQPPPGGAAGGTACASRTQLASRLPATIQLRRLKNQRAGASRANAPGSASARQAAARAAAPPAESRSVSSGMTVLQRMSVQRQFSAVWRS